MIQDADHHADNGNAGGRLRVAGEEVVTLLVEEIDEDATQWARRRVGAQQPAAIYDGPPALADAAASGEVPRRDVPEDLVEELVGEIHVQLGFWSLASLLRGQRRRREY